MDQSDAALAFFPCRVSLHSLEHTHHLDRE